MPVTAGQILRPLVRIGKTPDECWQWLGARDGKGYGIKEYLGRTIRASRWMWIQLFGPLTEDDCISASCGTPGCVNPHHLRLMSIAEVNRETRSGLTAADVSDIRMLADNGVYADRLAERFMVDKSTIYRIIAKKSWATPKHKKTKTPSKRLAAVSGDDIFH